FEALHHGMGALFAICELRLDLLREKRAAIENEINSIRSELAASQVEVAASVEELIKIFWVHISNYNQNTKLRGIVLEGNTVGLNDLLQWNKFSQLFKQKNLMLTVNTHNLSYTENISLGKSFADIES